VATKEDILEQIVEEYLTHKGYFVRHNIKFKPRDDHPEWISNQDSNHSDIDVVGFNPLKAGPERIYAVSCKNWQGGFDPRFWLKKLEGEALTEVSGRPAWKHFRELKKEKWADAFRCAIKDITESEQFTYVLAVARLDADRTYWENHPPFITAMGGNPIKIVTFSDMLGEIRNKLGTTVAATEIGRLIQVLKASRYKLEAA